MTVIQLPASLDEIGDLFAPAPAGTDRNSVSVGMFGPAFSLRLARAEAAAAGGDLARQGELLILSLPLANGQKGDKSHGKQ
jgi:hypothetical protein